MASLIDLSNMSQPVTTLIEKVSDAVGGIFKPLQMRRIADAEKSVSVIRAEADEAVRLIKARSEVAATSMDRGIYRLLTTEAKRQENIEEIVYRATGLLNKDSRPQEMENDWITHVFDQCKDVSDSDMQSLWARIVAGEANLKGSFSKRTINMISMLDKADAVLFTNFCKTVWMIGGPTAIVTDVTNDIYVKNNINFNIVKHLSDIGLIRFETI
jgi:hypothetical protein